MLQPCPATVVKSLDAYVNRPMYTISTVRQKHLTPYEDCWLLEGGGVCSARLQKAVSSFRVYFYEKQAKQGRKF